MEKLNFSFPIKLLLHKSLLISIALLSVLTFFFPNLMKLFCQFFTKNALHLLKISFESPSMSNTPIWLLDISLSLTKIYF